MNILEKYPEEKVEKVVYKKITQRNVDDGVYDNFVELHYPSNMVAIFPEGDCCSFSYLVEITKYPFKNLKNKKITDIYKVTDKKLIDELYKYKRFLDLRDSKYNTGEDQSYLYKVDLSSRENFYFGLINSSNGWYEGWIDVVESPKPGSEFTFLDM